MSKERQIRKQEEVRKTILDVAREIISREGIDGLSIRKITNAIDYSPAIIYHYFKDKNDIIESVVNEGYMEILASIRSVERNEAEPEEEVKQIFVKYIKAALASPEVYKAVMLNDDPTVLRRTSLLMEGIAKKSPTVQVLSSNIERGISLGRYAPCDPELTAQIIWTASFGLLIKLIIEKNIPEEQVDRLIEQHFTILFNGIMTRKAEKI